MIPEGDASTARFCESGHRRPKRVELVLGQGDPAATIDAPDGPPKVARVLHALTVADALLERGLSGTAYKPSTRTTHPRARPRFPLVSPRGVFEAVGRLLRPDRQFAWDEGGWRGDRPGRPRVLRAARRHASPPEGTFDAGHPSCCPNWLRWAITAVEIDAGGAVSRESGAGGMTGSSRSRSRTLVRRSRGVEERLDRERATSSGMAVILDQIYNHFGPEGNVLPDVRPLPDRPSTKTDWGACAQLRRQGVRRGPGDRSSSNVRMWIGEYRFDGLRLDAADQIYRPGADARSFAEIGHRRPPRGRHRTRPPRRTCSPRPTSTTPPGFSERPSRPAATASTVTGPTTSTTPSTYDSSPARPTATTRTSPAVPTAVGQGLWPSVFLNDGVV